MNGLVRTQDGSLSKFHEPTGELYHNRAGAYTEALHNYVLPCDPVTRLQKNGQLKVLDACFGLGYNSFVLIEQLMRAGAAGNVHICAVETDPEILKCLPDVLCDQRFSLLADCRPSLPAGFGQFSFAGSALQVQLDLRQIDLRKFAEEPALEFDFIFHDPFSPRKVPQLWTVELFVRYYRALKGGNGRLLTYSAASAVRAGLHEVGFGVYRTAGVGEKSGGTLATVDQNYAPGAGVSALDQEVVKRWRTATGVPYRDGGTDCSADDMHDRRAREQASR